MIRDVLENAGLEGFAEIGLVLFVIAFLLVIIRILLMSKEEAQEHAEIPLQDGDDNDLNHSSGDAR